MEDGNRPTLSNNSRFAGLGADRDIFQGKWVDHIAEAFEDAPEGREDNLRELNDLRWTADIMPWYRFQFTYKRPYWERVWIVEEVILAK